MMMAFEQLPLIRDITQYKTDVTPQTSKLEIVISDARQVFPPEQNTNMADLLLITAGTVRFGWDDDNALEDRTNEFDEDSEVDEGIRRTVRLNLNDLPSRHNQLIGGSAFAALGNCGLTREDDFLAAVDNAGVDVAQPADQPQITPTDIMFFSDVVAGPVGGESRTQLNRLGYQAMVLLQSSAK